MSFPLRSLSGAIILTWLLGSLLAVSAGAAQQGPPDATSNGEQGAEPVEPGADDKEKEKKKKSLEKGPDDQEGAATGQDQPSGTETDLKKPDKKKQLDDPAGYQAQPGFQAPDKTRPFSRRKDGPNNGTPNPFPTFGKKLEPKILNPEAGPAKDPDAGLDVVAPKDAQSLKTKIKKKKKYDGDPPTEQAGPEPGEGPPPKTGEQGQFKPAEKGSPQPAELTAPKVVKSPEPIGEAIQAPVVGVGPVPKKGEKKEDRVARHKKQFEDLKKQRRLVVEDGGKRHIIDEPDKRRIIREDGRVTIRHDETARFRRLSPHDTREERRPDGSKITIVLRPGGIQIFTEIDDDGRPLRRWRRHRDGREVVLFDNRGYYRRFGPRRPSFLDAIVNLAPPVIRIPRERYIVDYDRASDDDIFDTLTAPPVDQFAHPYSLEEIRQSRYLRERMRRLDLDTISFDFGSWEVDFDEYPKLERLARIMNRILERNPDEMFMIEGYTDAVGSEDDNLTLSDRRAESVAIILTENFDVAPENLTTQGYGEQFLKIETEGPEPGNRIVAVRRITPLLAR